MHQHHIQKVQTALKQDRDKRAKDVGESIEAKLVAGEIQEAWQLLKGTLKRIELYQNVPPPGDSMPINVQPFAINDTVHQMSQKFVQL